MSDAYGQESPAGPAAGGAPGGPMGRRDFVQLAMRGSLALALGPAWLLPLAAAAPAPAGGPPPAAVPSESTRRMAALLQKITREADPLRNPFRSAEQAVLLRGMAEHASDPRELIRIRIQLAQQILQAGRPDEALRENEEIERLMNANGVALDDQVLPELLTAKAMCYMRMGEQENCCANHNADSCMFPIHGMGIHTK